MLPIAPLSKKLLILALVSMLLACGGSEERKAKYMEEGKQLFAEGNYQKAMLSYKNVLQIDPKDINARYQMAEAQSKLGELQGAASQYLAVIGEDPKHLKSRLRMGQIYLMVNQLDNAEEMAKEVQTIDPQNVEGIVLMSGVFIAKNNIEAAYKQLEIALSKQPDDVQANLVKASLDARAGKVDQAISSLHKISEQNPTNTSPELMLAKLYTETKNLDKAQQALEQIIKIQPDVLENRKRLTLFLIAANKLDNAEVVMRTAVKELPNDATAKLLLIDFLVTKRTPEIAVTELLPMIKDKPDQYDLRFKLAELEFAQKNAEKGEQALKEIVELDKMGPQSIKARNKLARLYVATKREDDAKILLKQIIEENPHDIEALQLRGEFALNEKRLPEAIGDFRAVLVDQPQNLKVLKLLTTAHLMNKDAILARENIEKIISIAPADEEARLELANLLIQAGEGERAVLQVEELTKVNPKSKAGLEALFKAYLSKKQWDKAQDAANRVQSAYPDEGLGYFLSGLGYQAEGKVEASIPVFEKALAKQTDSVEPLTQLIKSYLVLKQTDKALAKLNATIKQQPQNFVAYNLMGDVYLNEKKFDEAIVAFKKASTIKPEWPIPYRMIAISYAAQGKKVEAIKAFLDGIATTNSAMELVNDLATIYQQAGEHKKAIALYEQAYKAHPESAEALNNLVSYLSDYANDKAELERAAKLAEPLATLENPNALDTVGWIAYKLGDYAKAEAYLVKATTALPNLAISNYHLGMIYYKQNNTVKAKAYLQKAIDQKSEFTGIDVAKETLKQLG